MVESVRRLPLEIYSDVLSKLSLATLEDVKRDQQLVADGWHIYYAVDHHEISHFCYPIDMGKIGEYKEEELQKISRDQHGLEEALHKQQSTPILLKPYFAELEGLTRFIEGSSGAYKDSEIVDEYVLYAGLDEESLRIGGTKETVDFLKKNLKNILAIALGVHSIGSARLYQIVTNRLLYNQFPESERIDLDFDELPRTSVWGHIYSGLSEEMEQTWSEYSPSEIYIRRLSNSRDATAIDQILQINNFLQKKHRKVFLAYLSSAAKTSSSLRSRAALAALPTIKGEKYNILRTSEHMFAYVISRGMNDDEVKRARETIENIDRSLEIIKDFERIKNDLTKQHHICQECIKRYRSDTSCSLLSVCNGLRELGKALDSKQENASSIALVRSVGDYVKKFRLLKSDSPHSCYIKYVRQINAHRIKSAVLEEIKVLYNLVRIRSSFASEIPSVLAQERYYSAVGPITCILQRFPMWIKTQVMEDAELKAIVQGIVNYVMTVRSPTKEKLDSLGKILNAYLEHDARFVRQGESELVRCLLYLVLDKEDYVNRAHLQAKALLGNHKQGDQEFRYILTFAARNLRRYRESMHYCDVSIGHDHKDARFYHSRSLTIFSWLEDMKTEEKCDKTIAQAVKDAESAIAKYSDDRNMVGVNYANLAYFYSYKKSEIFNVKEAVHCLEKLEQFIPPIEWDPKYPEFLHSEATVLHRYAQAHPSEKNARHKLEQAFVSAKRALNLYPTKVSYGKLVTKINAALAKFHA